MYAPVVTRFNTYDIALEPLCQAYCDRVTAMPEVQEWIRGAEAEPDDIAELEVDF